MASYTLRVVKMEPSRCGRIALGHMVCGGRMTRSEAWNEGNWNVWKMKCTSFWQRGCIMSEHL